MSSCPSDAQTIYQTPCITDCAAHQYTSPYCAPQRLLYIIHGQDQFYSEMETITVILYVLRFISTSSIYLYPNYHWYLTNHAAVKWGNFYTPKCRHSGIDIIYIMQLRSSKNLEFTVVISLKKCWNWFYKSALSFNHRWSNQYNNSITFIWTIFMQDAQHLTFNQLFWWRGISNHPIPTWMWLPTVVSVDTGLMVQVSRRWLQLSVMLGHGLPSEFALVSLNEKHCNAICFVYHLLCNMQNIQITGTIWIFSIADIDECQEGISGCDAVRENCTNLVGGVSCQCLSQYFRVEGRCQCELNKYPFSSSVCQVSFINAGVTMVGPNCIT